LSICLVEDNPGDVALIREALTEHDVRADLVLFEDGERAFGYFQELDQNEGSCPDLLLLDLNLPKVSGWEVFDFVRRSARCASVSVIVLSSSDAAMDKAKAERLGSVRYIRKPSNLEDFMQIGAIIRGVLQARLD
jgi:DNA-binding response OmpR family regulator